MEQWLRERDATFDELKFKLLKTQHCMKLTADLKRMDVSFTVGEVVYLSYNLIASNPKLVTIVTTCLLASMDLMKFWLKWVMWLINWIYLLLAKSIMSFTFHN